MYTVAGAGAAIAAVSMRPSPACFYGIEVILLNDLKNQAMKRACHLFGGGGRSSRARCWGTSTCQDPAVCYRCESESFRIF
jgi:hypothetical protein